MTIEIQRSKGLSVIVDDIDADLGVYKWSSNKYYALRRVKVNGKASNIILHRVVMERALGRVLDKKELVDHINGNPLDNTRNNLRVATNQQNLHNSKKRRNNTSGYKGVNFRKDHNKWEAQIKYDNKKVHLGYFNTPEEAHKAYCDGAKKYHGEFARTE